ncbi:MAG: rhomboid family intramembrane serine protease [Acidobacteriota bacterium]
MLNQWLQIVVLSGAYLAASGYLRTAGPWGAGREPTSSRATATMVLTLVLCVTAMLQWTFPAVLSAFQRDATRIATGEWWHLGTALLVQDGGVAGTVFNLISLLLVGSAAERLLGSRRWLPIFLVGALISELIALTWRPIGAGNSVATFSLAGAVSVRCVTERPSVAVFLAAAVTLTSGVALLVVRDIHGAATFAGAVIGLVFIARDRPAERQ